MPPKSISQTSLVRMESGVGTSCLRWRLTAAAAAIAIIKGKGVLAEKFLQFMTRKAHPQPSVHLGRSTTLRRLQ